MYYLKDNGELSVVAFYESLGLILFSSKILRENWAKEDHDAIKEIVLEKGERLVGI